MYIFKGIPSIALQIHVRDTRNSKDEHFCLYVHFTYLKLIKYTIWVEGHGVGENESRYLRGFALFKKISLKPALFVSKSLFFPC